MTSIAIAAEIAQAYAEAGQAAGNGIGAVQVTIKRAVQPTGPVYAPTPGVEIPHTFDALPADREYTQITGTAVGAQECVYSLVNHGVTIEPTTADELEIDGKTWSVVEVMPQDAAGGVLTWLVKAKLAS